jgi:hypothetical protein
MPAKAGIEGFPLNPAFGPSNPCYSGFLNCVAVYLALAIRFEKTLELVPLSSTLVFLVPLCDINAQTKSRGLPRGSLTFPGFRTNS